jgi:alanine dehydrogenase
MTPRIAPEHTLEPQLSPIEVSTNDVRATIGMLVSDDIFAPLLLSLKQIEELVDDRMAVLVQRGLGIEHDISDYNFTEYGADIMEDELPIIALSDIVLKYEPFSLEEIFFLKEKQTIISMAHPEAFTYEMIQFLHEKKITAIGINFLNIENSQIQNVVKQLVSVLVFSKKITHNIQLNPLFLKSVYCYNGEICNRAIAEHAGVPWKDLVELCWNWN